MCSCEGEWENDQELPTPTKQFPLLWTCDEGRGEGPSQEPGVEVCIL